MTAYRLRTNLGEVFLVADSISETEKHFLELANNGKFDHNKLPGAQYNPKVYSVEELGVVSNL